MAHIIYSKRLKQAVCNTYSKVIRHRELWKTFFFFLLNLEKQTKKFKVRHINFDSSIIVLIM